MIFTLNAPFVVVEGAVRPVPLIRGTCNKSGFGVRQVEQRNRFGSSFPRRRESSAFVKPGVERQSDERTGFRVKPGMTAPKRFRVIT